MQYKVLAASALAATAFAKPEAKEEAVSSIDLTSVLSVLATALPSSLLAQAETNSVAVSSEIASEISAGHTPGWFASLPSDIKPIFGAAVTTSDTATSSGAAITSGPLITMNTTVTALPHGTAGAHNSSAILSAHSSMRSKISSAESSLTSAAGSTSSPSGSSSTSSGGAAMPTAIMGAGLAGAMGLVGLLAL